MATTQNTYTGDGSTTNYSFTFEYLKQSDVKVTLDTVATTAFTFANATTLSFTTAPANGVAIRIFRDTAIDILSATFFPGSAIKAEDLNQNFTQSLYVTQESDADAASATTAANTAKTTADTALADSATAISTANAATTTANTANTNASAAVVTANAAVTTANTADTNATAAVNTANAASAAVSQAVLFTLIANVAAIPGSPSNNDYIEIGDSTGVESFSPLSGVPSGFVGASGLSVRLRYDSSAASWVWMSYFANDSEDRYLTKNLPVVTGDSTNGSGQITLNCEVNTHGVKIKGPPHSAAADYTLTLPNDDGTSSQVLSTDGSGVLSWADQPDISGKANTSDIGTTIQAFDADTAKTDTAQTFTAAQRGTIGTLTDGATITPDFATANNFTVTLAGNRTIANPTNLTAGQSGSIFIVQDGTGSRTAAWGSYWDFAAGTAPTLTTTAAGVDRVDYIVRSATSIHTVFTGNYS